MKLLVVICAILACSQARSYLEQTRQEWHSFKLQHSKAYSSEAEEEYRMKVFLDNKNKIDKHNEEYEQEKVTFAMGLNQFADMTHEEYKNRFSKIPFNKDEKKLMFEDDRGSSIDLPNSFDWRDLGAVTPARDQGDCHGSWAISAVGVLETQYFNKTGYLVPLSAQNLIDCAAVRVGCRIHDPNVGFHYASMYAINREADYPYEDRAYTCRLNYDKPYVESSDYHFIRWENITDAKLKLVTVGPIATRINTEPGTFMFYKTGVYNDKTCSTDPDDTTMVGLLVGWGTENDEEYWIVRNAWGESWGEEGYINIATKDNICGVLTVASYADLRMPKNVSS